MVGQVAASFVSILEAPRVGDDAEATTAESTVPSFTELKWTVSGLDLHRAKQAFGLSKKRGSFRRVTFYDTGTHTLAARGVYLRSRRDEDHAEESTIKVIVGDDASPAAEWRGEKGFKWERDEIIGGRGRIACSFTRRQTAGEIDAVARGERSVRKLFSEEQERFAEALANNVPWDDLRPFGPVSAWVWRVTVEAFSERLSFERWELPEGRIVLEASVRVAAERAAPVAAALQELLILAGIEQAEAGETKTQMLLDSFSPRTLESVVQESPIAAETTANIEPLRIEHMDALRQLFATNPDEMCAYLAAARGQPVERAEVPALLDEMQRRLEEPEADIVAEALESVRAPVPPPADFTFDGYAPAEIPIDVADTRFETKADWFQYAKQGGLNAALYHAGLLPLPPFRWHHDHASDFGYPLNREPGTDLRIALFADFANGYYHARYIAKQFVTRGYAYGIHLGDVYYAGTVAEVRDYLEKPLAPVLAAGMELFQLPGNHEMYGKARPWVDYLDRIRRAPGSRQRQEGTYFALWRDGFLIAGIDTSWLGHGRFTNSTLVSWLASRLRQGRREGRANILLSPDEPYSYGDEATTKLMADLAALVGEGLVDLWLWGNTHYAALFEPTDALPFVGSCIGHAGYPFSRHRADEPRPAPVRFLETDNRFGREDIRADRGNNGYCELVLRRDGRIGLRYIDWMGRTRHQAVVVPRGGGSGPRFE